MCVSKLLVDSKYALVVESVMGLKELDSLPAACLFKGTLPSSV